MESPPVGSDPSARRGLPAWSAAARMLGWLSLLFALLSARALWSARGEWNAAQDALRRDHSALAVTYLRRAASWHVPFSPYTSRALAALADIAKRERGRGRDEAALLAERAQRAARQASRTLAPGLPADPRPGFVLLALLGWLGWSAAGWALVSLGLDREGQLTPRALRALVALLVGFGMFVLGLAGA